MKNLTIHIKLNTGYLIDRIEDIIKNLKGDYTMIAKRVQPEGLVIQIRNNDLPDDFMNTINLVFNATQEHFFNEGTIGDAIKQANEAMASLGRQKTNWENHLLKNEISDYQNQNIKENKKQGMQIRNQTKNYGY